MDKKTEIETINDFLVGSTNRQTMVIGGCMATQPMTSTQAYRLAAWLVNVADMNRVDGEPSFEETLEAIRRT